jgi:GNAT superfamily N-acetyltransferase
MDDRSWHIRYLATAEASEALDILREASRWSTRFGAPMWPLESLTEQEHREVAGAGELVGGFEGAHMVVGMRLQKRDPIHWPDDAPGEALYLHKLAVRRASAGKGWMGRMVDWALTECRKQDVPALRLDTFPDSRLPSLYESLGFRLVDEGPRWFAGRWLVRMEQVIQHN